jgi:hypothetical protein
MLIFCICVLCIKAIGIWLELIVLESESPVEHVGKWLAKAMMIFVFLYSAYYLHYLA